MIRRFLLAPYVLVGLGLACCVGPPGPCWGLRIGDELVMTVDEVRQLTAGPPCAFDGLGLTIGRQLRMSVQEHQERDNGEEALCMPSAGPLESDTGWTYQPARMKVIYGVYGSKSLASKSGCRGYLSMELSVPTGSSLSQGSVPSQLSIDYLASDSAGDCPMSCRGQLSGTLVRADHQ